MLSAESDYEELRLHGDFGLEEGIGFEMVVQKLGGGRRRSKLYGRRCGERWWTLVYKVLPDTPDCRAPESLEARATHLWNFFCRHMTGYEEVNRPFIIRNIADGLRYLVSFDEPAMSRQMFMTKLYSSQLKIVSAVVPGVNTLDDGSLGDGTNPARI